MDSENSLEKLTEQYKWPLMAGVVGAVLLIGGIFSSGILQKTFIKSTKTPSSASTNSNQMQNYSMIKVDVSGAVISPGVYTLSSGARVEDAIKAAGGVTELADGEYVTKQVNLAQKLIDGAKVYIPASGWLEAGAGSGGQIAGESAKLVNVNAAAVSELDSLTGVGPVTAQKIIDGRPYQSIEELYTKKSVTRSVYEKIKDKVSVY